LKETFEEYHNLNITDEAVEEAINLSVRYITDRYLPDKAIDLIDEACSLKSMKYNLDETEIKKIKERILKEELNMQKSVIAQNYNKAQQIKTKIIELEKEITNLKKKFSIPKQERLSVNISDVQNVLSIATGIPVSNLNTDEINKLKNLESTIKTKII
jgi:ATP-dependent Clp protease ATP-binding subunit ClpC